MRHVVLPKLNEGKNIKKLYTLYQELSTINNFSTEW